MRVKIRWVKISACQLFTDIYILVLWCFKSIKCSWLLSIYAFRFKTSFFFSVKIDDLGYDLYSILVRHFKKTVTMERQNVIFKATFYIIRRAEMPSRGLTSLGYF